MQKLVLEINQLKSKVDWEWEMKERALAKIGDLKQENWRLEETVLEGN